MESLAGVIASLHERMAAFEGDLKKSTSPTTLEAISADYTAFKTFVLASLKALQQQVDLLARDVDHQEMRSRRKILLLHGCPEVNDEDTAGTIVKVMTSQMKMADFSTAHITRCHRMGRASSGDRPRPILIKLRDISMRDSVWSAKTNLKGSSCTLSEFLTRPRHAAFMKARELFGIKSCWTRDGQIHVIMPDGVRHRVSSLADVNKLKVQQEGASATIASTTAASTSTTNTKRPPSARLAGSSSAGRSRK